MPWVTTYCVQHVRLLYWQLKELTELTFWQIEGGPNGASLFFVLGGKNDQRFIR